MAFSSSPRSGCVVDRPAFNDFAAAVERLEQTFTAIGEVLGADGRSLIDTRGADRQLCSEWRHILNKIDDELNMWGRTFRRVFGTTPEPLSQDRDNREESIDASEAEDAYNASYTDWDHLEEGAQYIGGRPSRKKADQDRLVAKR